MAQNLTELCTILIEHHSGAIAAQLFAALAHNGRSTVPTLATHTQIPLRRLRSGLTKLLEEQLLLQFKGDDEATTSYSVNWRNAYNLARHTNIVNLVTDRYGEGAGQVVKNVLHLGHARVGELAGAYDLSSGSKRDSGCDTAAEHVTEEGLVNGIAKSSGQKQSRQLHITTASDFHSTLRTLLGSGILVKVGPRTFMPPTDVQDQIEEMVINEQFPGGKVTGPKKQLEFRSAVNVLKRKWREDDSYSELRDLSSRGTIKRPPFTDKRVKVNGDLPNGTHTDSGPKILNDLIVRVDIARCTLALRSRRLEELARRYLGGHTAAVYGALLECLEGKARDVRDNLALDDDNEEKREAALPRATTPEISALLDPALDLGATIKGLTSTKPLPNGVGKNGKRKHGEFAEIGIKDEHSDPEDDPPRNGYTSYGDRTKRFALIEAHLGLLQEHPKSFCKHAGGQQWLVDFPALTDTLIEAELDNTILARYDNVAMRTIRMLRERGRLQETEVAKCAMLRVKDVRSTLTHLQFHGIVDAQELPRDNTRQPSRTTYLWFFDTARVQHVVLQQTYKAMARTLQRVQVERDLYRTIIEKVERADVKGREQEKLAQNERQELRRWRETEERLLAQVARMDELVVVLRDLSGRDTSLTT